MDLYADTHVGSFSTPGRSVRRKNSGFQDSRPPTPTQAKLMSEAALRGVKDTSLPAKISISRFCWSSRTPALCSGIHHHTHTLPNGLGMPTQTRVFAPKPRIRPGFQDFASAACFSAVRSLLSTMPCQCARKFPSRMPRPHCTKLHPRAQHCFPAVQVCHVPTGYAIVHYRARNQFTCSVCCDVEQLSPLEDLATAPRALNT